MSNFEKLNNALRILNSVSVPTAFLESISIPIYNAAADIREVIQNMQKEQMNSNTPEIQIEPAEEMSDAKEATQE